MLLNYARTKIASASCCNDIVGKVDISLVAAFIVEKVMVSNARESTGQNCVRTVTYVCIAVRKSEQLHHI